MSDIFWYIFAVCEFTILYCITDWLMDHHELFYKPFEGQDHE